MTDSEIKKILVKKNFSKAEISTYELEAGKKKSSLENYIVENKIISEEDLYCFYAKLNKLNFIELKNKSIDSEIINLIPEMIANTHKIIAFEKKENTLQVATLNPNNLLIFDFLNKKLNLELEINISTPSEIKEALSYYHKDLQTKFGEMVKNQQELTNDKDQTESKINKKEFPVTKVVDAILENAIFQGASDIHIEPLEKEIIIRNRIDGVLKREMSLPKELLPELVSRIKVLSKLKIDEHRKPQDGRFKIRTEKYDFSFRVSTVPMFDGEKIVMRLLDESNKILALEQLGLNKKEVEMIKRCISRPNGIILVTGPTGSGKTTTLYTILNMLNTTEVNICTIEDPIEYRIPGINQSQINPKVEFTFANGLRAFLRQDPDIIMVGEIRDFETAEIAIHAAMTGHLVLSTLHTNDAVTTVPRLLEMGIPSFLIGSTLKLAIAQRLARKICSECKKPYKLNTTAYNELASLMDLENITQALKKHKILKPTQSLKNITYYKGEGCKKCNNEGYKGRVGIYELLEIDEKMSGLINQKPTSQTLNNAAVENGMITLVQDGFRKIINGITTVEELIRVTKE